MNGPVATALNMYEYYSYYDKVEAMIMILYQSLISNQGLSQIHSFLEKNLQTFDISQLHCSSQMDLQLHATQIKLHHRILNFNRIYYYPYPTMLYNFLFDRLSSYQNKMKLFIILLEFNYKNNANYNSYTSFFTLM